MGAAAPPELYPAAATYQTQRRVGQRHPLAHNKGQQQCSGSGEPLFTTQHDARNQWVHWQHAWRKGDTNTDQQRPERGKGQLRGGLLLLRNRHRLWRCVVGDHFA